MDRVMDKQTKETGMNQPAVSAPAPAIDASVLSSVMLDGNLAKLNDSQKVQYMTAVCNSLGLNPLTKPFEFLSLNGKLVMYAKRDCTEQLRKIHGVSVTIAARDTVNDTFIVTARAQDVTGRVDESIGAVSLKGLSGEALANAFMKAETKAKRRVTLSLCGLGMLDETEAEPLGTVSPVKQEKIASITGEVKAKLPEWTPEQKTEAGTLRAEAIELGGEKRFGDLWSRMRYDAVSDFLDAAHKLLAELRDIADQANSGVQS